MSKRVPIDELIEDEQTPDIQKQLFKQILSIREFSSERLLLPENDSYKSYVALEHDYIIWNVFAAPKYSLAPINSCFFIVGCLQYKGFFAQKDAVNFASELRETGNDVYVGGVSAYSTLGWFDDPILSSMTSYGELRLAEVIFHELAHQLIYIKDDSAFNEAFATAVGDIGVRLWLKESNRQLDLVKFEKHKQWEVSFIELVLNTKRELKLLYDSKLTPDQMSKKKAETFDSLRADYHTLKARWDNPPNYDKWINNDLNNAKVASVVTYHDLASSFLQLFEQSEKDLGIFYDQVIHLGTLSKEMRHICLEKLLSEPHCYSR